MCEMCGAPLQGLKRRWCSKRCNNRYRSTVPSAVMTCAYCGRERAIVPNQLPEQRYCSRSCARADYNSKFLTGARNGRWRGGRVMSYGPGWKAIKELVRARDRVCTVCGTTPQDQGRALDVHHLVPFRFSGDNSLDNLVALCRACHMQADDHGRAGSATYLQQPRRPTKREIRRLKQLTRAAEIRARRYEQQRAVFDLHEAGLSLRQIARLVGVSHETVAKWLPFERTTMEERSARTARNKARALELRARGLSLRAIAAEIGVTHQAVQRWLKHDAVSEEPIPYERSA